jgi:hypothetical protein
MGKTVFFNTCYRVCQCVGFIKKDDMKFNIKSGEINEMSHGIY